MTNVHYSDCTCTEEFLADNPTAHAEGCPCLEDDETDDIASDDLVTIEEMPAHHRGSHRAAGNWGVYPHNGATRREVSREEADEIVAEDLDNYAHIVDG